MNILFILKHREVPYTDEQPYSYTYLSSGLLNSATMVSDMLVSEGINSKVVHAIDNNCIDRLVTENKTDICIIEAYWVVPEKFEVLTKLHPNIIWIIRNHSKVPFLANEGIAMSWTHRYFKYENVYVSSNSVQATKDIRNSFWVSPENTTLVQRTPLLPNYYPVNFYPRKKVKPTTHINVGCFGAIRPLKNQLIQAIAAIRFAEKHFLKLNFHINGTRIEGNGNPILHNLRGLFDKNTYHKLTEHKWYNHCTFREFCSHMDVGLQVSYSETFNIVSADLVSQGVPVVTSNEIEWVSEWYHANPNDSNDIVRKMERAVFPCISRDTSKSSRKNLEHYNHQSKKLWLETLERF